MAMSPTLIRDRRLLSRRFLTCVLLIVLAGCSRAEPWGRVTGQVLLEETPVPKAVVLFSCLPLGIEMTTVTDEQGNFQLTTANVPGLPAGEYRVAVFPAVYQSQAPKDNMIFELPPGKTDMLGEKKVEKKKNDKKPAAKKSGGPPEIPEMYRDVQTSGLTATIATGSNHFALRLKSET